MPCQCETTANVASDDDTTYSGCRCATQSATGCQCVSPPTPSDRESNLAQVVMELDKRVRKLEASR